MAKSIFRGTELSPFERCNLRRSLAARVGLPTSLAFALVLAFPLGAGATGAPPPAVGVMVAKKQPVYKDFSYIGRVVSPRIVNVQARVAGFLEKRLFKQGAHVAKGQVLYIIEQRPYQAALDQAKAAVAKAQAQLTNAKLVLSRAEKLLNSPAGQQSTVDQDRATADSDAADLASAEAALETAKVDFGYTQIRAPIAGRIGATAVNVGNVVGPTSGVLATIVSENPMRVAFSASLSDVNKLKGALAGHGGLTALDLEIRLPGGQVDKQRGKIDFLANQVDQNTDTLEILGSIPNPPLQGRNDGRSGNRALASGESVTVLLRSKAPEENVVLPRDAVLSDQVGDYVLAVNQKNVVVRRDVRLSKTTPATAAIASGITPGDLIIVDGIEKVHPGLTVAPQTIQPGAAQG